MELLNMLTSQLGISENQAEGGAGLIFNLAKDKLSSGEFDQILNKLPGIENLMSKAPKSDSGLMGALGGLTSSLGGGNLGDLGGLISGFSKLDLDSSLVTKFIPIIVDYAKSKGGEEIMSLLLKVLK